MYISYDETQIKDKIIEVYRTASTKTVLHSWLMLLILATIYLYTLIE